MSYFKYQGKNIYYEETGNGRPLLLLHGNTASSNMFYEITGKYAAHHKVILMDFLGHGRINLFDTGGHPAMLSNQQGFIEISSRFLED